MLTLSFSLAQSSKYRRIHVQHDMMLIEAPDQNVSMSLTTLEEHLRPIARCFVR